MTLSLRTLLEKNGYAPFEPSHFVAAEIVRHVSGEELSNKLFLTQDSEGHELALRYDYTLPLTLEFLNTRENFKNYSYHGSVFRQGRGEMTQTGVESFGREDTVQADADLLALALEACQTPCKLKMGDISLFLGLVQALDLPQAWRRRVIKHFRQGKALPSLSRTTPPQFPGLIAAIEGQSETVSLALVEDMLKIAGVKSQTGRSSQEIAARFLEEARRATTQLDPRKMQVLEQALLLEGSPVQVHAALTALTQQAGLDITHELAQFAARNAALAAKNIDLNRLEFKLAFAREPDYYDGFIFELYDMRHAQPLAGGGRYTKMTRLVSRFMGQERTIPAVGFTFFAERG